ncbi:sigma factor-like helix-turn-helix DNA-binding protein [Streptomyces sp. NPDC051001]|uniref:sigma factor-like helix-turn-helix DNA-binding protein n=1 Tax=Streptomyces sp. NPDC051001 TaxID=3155795 RepID=UPI0034169CFF
MSRSEEFEKARPSLFSIAHRILGSEAEAEAEQVVQETWLRYAAETVAPASPEKYLMAEVTRIAMRRLVRPRPGPTAAVALLEQLSPLERAVFVLSEIFGCDVSEIASAVGCSEAACRRLAGAVSLMSDPVPWPRRIEGAELVARTLAAIVPALLRIGVTLEQQEISRRPGAVFRDREGRALSSLALDFLDGRIHSIRWLTRSQSGT